MELAEIVAFAQRFWVVWLLALFIGILVWVFWPGRKQEMDRYARIPLDDDGADPGGLRGWPESGPEAGPESGDKAVRTGRSETGRTGE